MLLVTALFGCRPAPPPAHPGEPPGTPTPPPSTGDTGVPGDTVAPGDTAPPVPPPCGELAGAFSVGGPDHEGTEVVAASADGGLFVGGYFTGTLALDPGGPAETTLVGAGGFSGLVVHTGVDGAVRWGTSLVSTVFVTTGGLAATSDGGVVVVGSFGGAATFGTEDGAPVLPSAGEEDGFVARLGPDGGVRWAVRLGGPETDRASDVAVLADGSVLVVGIHGADATFGPGGPRETVLELAPIAYEAGFVARYDPDGRLAWAQGFGGTASARAEAAALDPVTGELVVVGNVAGPGVASFPTDPPRTVDPEGFAGFVARWAAGGGARSVVTFDAEWPSDVAVASDGGAVVGGTFGGEATFGAGEPGETTLTSAAVTDAFAAVFAPDGTLRWAAQSTSQRTSQTSGRGVAATDDAGVVLMGEFSASTRFGSGTATETTFTSRGASDPFVARFDRAGELRCAVWLASPDRDYGGAVEALGDGRFVTVGDDNADLEISPGTTFETTLPHAGGSDGFVATWSF